MGDIKCIIVNHAQRQGKRLLAAIVQYLTIKNSSRNRHYTVH